LSDADVGSVFFDSRIACLIFLRKTERLIFISINTM
jgi:hypothetical protein